MKMKFCTKTYRTKSLGWSEQQVPITVYFEEEVVGNYYADIPLAIILNFSKEKLEYKRIVK